jgi:hypothetical protein
MPQTSSTRSQVKLSGEVEKRDLAWPLPKEPFAPAAYDRSDVAAFKALSEGRADSYQQQLCLEWIMYASGAYANAFRPGADGARDTDFALGKAWVGQQIVKLINLPMRKSEDTEQG